MELPTKIFPAYGPLPITYRLLKQKIPLCHWKDGHRLAF